MWFVKIRIYFTNFGHKIESKRKLVCKNSEIYLIYISKNGECGEDRRLCSYSSCCGPESNIARSEEENKSKCHVVWVKDFCVPDLRLKNSSICVYEPSIVKTFFNPSYLLFFQLLWWTDVVKFSFISFFFFERLSFSFNFNEETFIHINQEEEEPLLWDGFHFRTISYFQDHISFNVDNLTHLDRNDLIAQI